ncbi:unnamed protein product [Brassica rapa subsp. trilocularis]
MLPSVESARARRRRSAAPSSREWRVSRRDVSSTMDLPSCAEAEPQEEWFNGRRNSLLSGYWRCKFLVVEFTLLKSLISGPDSFAVSKARPFVLCGSVLVRALMDQAIGDSDRSGMRRLGVFGSRSGGYRMACRG